MGRPGTWNDGCIVTLFLLPFTAAFWRAVLGSVRRG